MNTRSAVEPALPLGEEVVDLTDYASWWRRVVAFVFDVTILSIAPFAIALAGFLLAFDGADTDLYWSLDMLVSGIILATLLGIVSSTIYFTLFIGRSGQTLGMRIFGIAVRDARAVTQPIGYWRALARWLLIGVLWGLYYVPGIVDSLWPLWDKRRQSWHDKAVRSIVVHA